MPTTPTRVLTDVEFETMPSLTYGIDFENKRIGGMVDQHDAIRQAILKVLNTERYRYLAYTWNYGVELEDLFGKAIPYVCPEIERRITEALEWDDRINKVHDFEFDLSVWNVVSVSFICDTIFGDVAIEQYHVIEPPELRYEPSAEDLITDVLFLEDENSELIYTRPEELDKNVAFYLEDEELMMSATSRFRKKIRLTLDEETGELGAEYDV